MNKSMFENLEGTVQHIVSALQAELDELIERKANLKRRRRILLQTMRKRSANRRALPSGDRNSSRFRRSLKRSRAGAREIHSLYDRLLRACRIAFLEGGGIATPDEIFAAILRRQSFQFHLLAESPRSAIARTLTLMSEMKEA